jgi:DNA-binding CsgD family transcriptional regulator
MPRGKQLAVREKVMAWFAEGVSTKEIANRLKRDPAL